jgi:hypothetical protein
MKSFLNKAKGKLGLELMLLGIAPVAGIILGAKAYQQPPAIVAQASQEKQAPSASYNQQGAEQSQEDNVGVFMPLYYDQLTDNPQMYLVSANNIYRVKIFEGDTILKYVRGEDWRIYQIIKDNDKNSDEERWAVATSPSDSLIGVLRSAFNGNKALIAGEYFILEDADRDKRIFGRDVEEKDKVPIEEFQRIINKNVYNINNGRKK